jgi:diacylglycerol kinase family enzyme
MSTASTDPELRLESRFGLEGGTPSRRMLVIVNPYATTVSDRLKNLVVYALRGSYQVDAIDTERREHATDLCREAAREGYDVVVAFGGDGTVNEAANGLAGSQTVLTCLPGGRANVYCRILGIPTDVVDATEHLLSLADDWRPRPVDLGRAGSRYFAFSAGVGLDASVVEKVDAHPRLKARAGEYYYAWVATKTLTGRYLRRPPHLEAELGGERVQGVTALIQNANPYTYFGKRAIEAEQGATLDSGDLAGVIMKRALPIDIPGVTFRALSRRARVAAHGQMHAFAGLSELRVQSTDGRPLPVQVDGDYIGEMAAIDFSVRRHGLLVVA